MYTLTKYATSASQVSGNWSTISNATGVEDGAVAQDINVGSGHFATPLSLKGFGFTLPTTAVVYGIKVEARVSGGAGFLVSDADMYLLYGTSSQTSQSNSPDLGQTWQTGLIFNTYGQSNNALWGRTWTPAEINSANFGVALSANPKTGSTTTQVDAVRITIYWDYPPLAPGTIQEKQHMYLVYRQGTYLGQLPKVSSEFSIAQDINTAGVQLQITCAISADTVGLGVETIDDETGAALQAETGDVLTTEKFPDLIGNNNSSAMFRNGNQLYVIEVSNYTPNGKQVFTGDIERWAAVYGGDEGDEIRLTAYSDAADLNNFAMTGGSTLDQSMTTNNGTVTLTEFTGAGWNRYGQSFITGAGVPNLGAISVYSPGGFDLTMNIYSGIFGTLLTTITQTIPYTGVATEYLFTLAPIIVVPAGTVMSYTLQAGPGQSGQVYTATSDVYASGSRFVSNYGGGSGGGSYASESADLMFRTYYGGNSTTVTYTSTDPSNMLIDAIARYNAKGGVVRTTSSSVDLTGLSLTYTFKVKTLLEGIQSILAMAPYNFYWYVDPGTNILYFKRLSTTAKYTLIKGRHLTGINIAASTENVKNTLLFTGGPVAGVNLFSQYSDAVSIANNKPRLDRQTDNRVTVQATADAIGNSFIQGNKDEIYQTSVSVLDNTMDISLFNVGDTIGFGGVGNFIDGLVLQVARISKGYRKAILTLGDLPPSTNQILRDVQQGLTDADTLNNPNTPS